MQFSRQAVADKQSQGTLALSETNIWHEDGVPAAPTDLFGLLEGFCLLDGRARMVLRRDGRYLAGSTGVDDIFRQGTCLHMRDGVVRVSMPEYSDELQKLLAVKAPEVRTLALPCWMSDGHLLIRSTSISRSAVCFSLQRATQMIEPQLPDLQIVFGLTNAEARIVDDLFLGYTPQQIAQSHDNSIHTIRAHIRRCYDKLGITCREELWRKLNAYRLT